MNEYDDLLDADDKRTQLRTTMYGAVGSNPEQYSEAVRLGRATGVPAPVAARNLDQVRRAAKLNEYDALMDSSPALADHYAANPDFARAAHDDAAPLADMEASFRAAQVQGRAVAGRVDEPFTRPMGGVRGSQGRVGEQFIRRGEMEQRQRGFFGGISEPLARGLAQSDRAMTLLDMFPALRERQSAARQAAGLPPDPSLEVRLSEQQRLIERYPTPPSVEEGLRQISGSKTMGEAFRNIVTNPRAVLETTLESFGASAPAMVGTTVGGALAGPLGAAAGTGLGSFAVEYASTVSDVLGDKGIDQRDPEAIRRALADPELMAAARQKGIKRGIPVAFFDALTAGLAGRLVGRAVRSPSARTIGAAVVGETALQSAGGAAGEAVAQAATGEYKPGDILMEAIAELPTAVVEIPHGYHSSMRQAEQHAGQAERFAAAVEQTKTKARDPVAFKEYVAALSESGAAPTELWVEPEHLANSLNQSAITVEELRALAPETAAQLEAAVPGASIRVPLTEFAAAPAELTAGLIDHLRETPDAMSRAEGREFIKNEGENIRGEVERALTSHIEGEDRRVEFERVQQQFQQQLDAIGKHTADANKVYAGVLARFYTETAARAGVPIEQFLRDYRLDVTTAQPVPRGTAAARQELTQRAAAQYRTVQPGEMVDGRTVRADIPNQASIRATLEDHRVLPGIREIPLSAFDPEYLAGVTRESVDDRTRSLADEIAASREINPLIVAFDAQGPYIVEGGHRFDALIASGAKSVPAMVVVDESNPPAMELYQRGVQSKVKEPTPAITRLLKNLTPAEQRKITDKTAAKIIDLLKDLPSAKEMAAVAHAGRAKRGWYAGSAEAISAVFAQDGPRFAALLAATSPQCSVEDNLLNALNVWKNWTAAGRPTDREAIIDIMGASVQGSRGRESVLDAWINNSVRALTTENPADAETTRVLLSGPKVNSFFLNLIGVVDEVTNDAWMANFALVDQTIFSGSLNALGTDPGKGSGYLAMSARTREAAAMLTKLTGEQWTPAEVQETVWSWAKALYETADAATEPRSAEQIVQGRGLTDDLINATPDFRSLFYNAEYQQILEDAGYGDQLRQLQEGAGRPDAGQPREEPSAGGQAAPFADEAQLRFERSAARRLDALRKRRRDAAAAEAARTAAGGGRPEPARDRGGRAAGRGAAGGALAQPERAVAGPLPGAPSIVGATGPDPGIVAVAERYARDNGIPLARQAEYAQVDPERASRIAAAYGAMPHAPNDPIVREAYENLIRQTRAQYDALVAAGYKFWFLDPATPAGQQYASTPWNAMRDLRANRSMGVFPTEEGFGTAPAGSDNPLVTDTGLQWPQGSPDGPLRPVLANDLFRAVHDAFGHGLEGAGFRAQGEENAWQAHVRLFTGSAVGAITTETRGQNSWVNYGPSGETNRTAQTEGTVFAEQKTGLMPEWTSTEGRVADEPNVLEQGPEVGGAPPRGTISFANDITSQPSLIRLLADANLSTFIHESGHFFLEIQADLAAKVQRKIFNERYTAEPVSAGERGIAEDMERILEWMEVPPGDSGLRLDTWSAMTLQEKESRHEMWARGIERFFMEGKAPSLDLQPLFSRVRSWMLNIYKTLRGLNVTLTPEVRQVMGRMLASDQAIAEAEMARGMGPMFQSPEQAGMTPEEFADYHARAQRTTESATAELDAKLMKDMKWMSRARAKVIKERQAEAEDLRRQMRMEVTPEVMASDVYRAWEALTARGDPIMPGTVIDPGPTPVLRLNPAQVAELAPDTLETLKARRMTHTQKGWHPDLVAERFGFESGQQMLKALAAAPPPREVIEQLVDARMLERYGDITSDAALQQAADEAVHNQLRARVIATELKALAKANRVKESGTSVISRDTVDVLAKAAEEYAAQVIARQRLKDLRPGQYAAAEARSAKLAQQALGKSLPEAAMHKRNQLINNFATKAAYEAQAEIAKAKVFFRRVLTGAADTVAKQRDFDIVQAMRAILAEYGVGARGERAQAYLAALQNHDPATFGVLNERVNLLTLNAKPLNELTVEEFRGLVDELRSMWEMAKRNREVVVDGKRISLETAKMELAAQMQAIGVPARVPGEGHAVTDGERLMTKFRTAVSFLRRVESWAETMDGGPRGPFHTYVWNPIKDAADIVRRESAKYLRSYRDLLGALALEKQGLVDARTELGYTFGKSHGGVAKTELLHAILHTGNESNKRKLLLGRGWATLLPDGTVDTSRWDTFVRRMITEGVLTKKDFDFAQGIWDMLEGMKEGAQKTHREVFGRSFDEITANEFTIQFPDGPVIYRGGYVPALTDPELVKDAATRAIMEEQNQTLVNAFPSTPKGFTKARVEYNQPLLLDLRSLTGHINKVLLFTHMEQAVRDVRRVLSSNEVSAPLHRMQPTAYDTMLTPWLMTSARQKIEMPTPGDNGLMRGLSVFRNRVGMSTMFANISNTVQQLTGYFTAAATGVKWKHILAAQVQYTKGPRQLARAVAAASTYMDSRMENEVAAMNDAINQILIDPSIYQSAQAFAAKHAYFMQSAFDNVMGPVIWTAAFNQAQEEMGGDPRYADPADMHREAVRYADSRIRMSQGSTLPEDVSRIEAGNAFARLFMQFAGYFNMQANLLGGRFVTILREGGLRNGMGRGAYLFLMGFYIPATVAQLIATAFRGGPDDEDKDGEYLDDWLTTVFMVGPLKNLFAMVPGVGQLANMALNQIFTDNPTDDKMSVSPAVSMLETAMNAPRDIYRAVVDDTNRRRAVRDLATVIAMTTGLPATAVARPLGYLLDVQQENVTPTGPADAVRGLVTGAASPESKNR